MYLQEKPKGMELSPKPVGTAYKKIVPSAELPNIQIRWILLLLIGKCISNPDVQGEFLAEGPK